jgi:hypothetical protein
MDYDLSRLNSRSFEQLIQVLGTKVLGQGLIPFGDGPDGGREGVISGRVPYPSEGEAWEGSIVLQAKFRQRPQGTGQDGQWAFEQLALELARYDLGTNRKVPDYLIFATNVTLSAVQDSGAKDRLLGLAAEVITKHGKARQEGAQAGLRGFDIWDYDKLRVYLDQFEDVRRSFGAYVLPGDVLAETVATMEAIRDRQPDFDDSVSLFLQKELLAEQWVNLDQTGTTTDEQVPVSRVFVDLPVFPQRRADPPEETTDTLIPGFAAHVVEVAARRHDRQSQEAERLAAGGAHHHPDEGRIVLLGGPGQGKSTIGQFICQMFRVALLRSRPQHSLAPEVLPVLSTVESHCLEDGLALPSVRRFPLRVELSDFAKELASPDGAGSLLEYLARRFSGLVPGEVPPELMLNWLAKYPWLLVLDGLDEVPASSNREAVMAAVSDFWVDMATYDADCMVIATTRPQGYGEEFSPSLYRHTWLAPISTARALHYADRLLAVRFPHDTERQTRIAGRLQDATSRPETARLMTSPLQVTIMAALLIGMGKPPPGRWSLFSQYYRVIYEREWEKETPAASVLRNYRRDVDVIHQRVALLLQVEGETTDQAEARMPRERFSEVVEARLEEEGHEAEEVAELSERIIEAACNRLVFLVGLQADQVGFELRSLQEFMAAEALLSATSDAVIEERLRTIAPLPAWRNVFLFAAGRCFSDLEQHRATIHAICVELDGAEEDRLAPVAMSGATLAIELLADGVAERRPRYERLFGREALRIVRRPPGPVHDQLAEVYGKALRTTYEEELRTALASTPFPATLGAWRTLAVMAARSVEWARPLLEEHLPPPDALGALIEALPVSARSPWLSERLAALCAAAPPAQSLPHGEHLQELDVLRFTPFWFRALVDPGKEFRRPRVIVTIRGKEAPELAAALLGVAGGRWLATATDRAAQETAPASWQPLLLALRFAADPSAESLSETLDALLAIEDFDAVRGAAAVAPWPLAALLRAASDRGGLEAIARLARGRRLGHLTQWQDAERRWQDGVGDEDIAYPPGGRLPYDAVIGFKGFPLVACSDLTATRPGWTAPRGMLEWLPEVTLHATRRRIAVALLTMLEHQRIDDTREALIPARDLAAVLREEDLADCTVLRLGALDNLQWEFPLGDEELDLVNALGEGFSGPHSGSLSQGLYGLLARAWAERPELDGVYRLLAIAWTEDQEAELTRLLLERQPNDRTRAANTLLRFKLASPATLSAVPLAPLVDEGAAWVMAAAEMLAQHSRGAADELAITALDSVLPASLWTHKAGLDAIARSLIGQRSSALASAERWQALKLFERPWHSAASTA